MNITIFLFMKKLLKVFLLSFFKYIIIKLKNYEHYHFKNCEIIFKIFFKFRFINVLFLSEKL